MSESKFSLAQVSEPELRIVVNVTVFPASPMPERRAALVLLERRGRELSVEVGAAPIWEDGPTTFVLQQRDIIGRCHLSTFILRENYPLGLAESCITTEHQACSASAPGPYSG